MTGKKTIKSAIESMMFVWGEPLDIKEVADIFGVEKKEIYSLCKELQEEYEQEGRGIVIREVNRSFQFVTRPENIDYIERLCTPVKHKRLSQSALEVLAIVAYKQPVTKGEVEAIRGIKCDRVIEGLMKKDLVAQLGRSDAVGRPMLYGTTDEFLAQFGFETLKDLPEISDIEGVLDETGYEAGIYSESGEEQILAEQISLLLPEKDD
ncbi:MAG: SMC-Scp complex subunit ScpB [Firmicutes bacterium]|nr:SMC-Scp complex subunit ScpB [Bacillota bacterium]